MDVEPPARGWLKLLQWIAWVRLKRRNVA